MALPLCPADCTTILPPVKFSKCAPKFALSEIRRVFIANEGAAPFTDWADAAEWTTRLSESDAADADSIRPLTVIGDKPAPTNIPKELSNGRTMSLGKNHLLNITIDDISDENYAFMQVSECGGKYRAWYETEGGYMYGGNKGLPVSLVLDDILNRGREEIETISGTISWRARRSPERVISPIFDGEENE